MRLGVEAALVRGTLVLGGVTVVADRCSVASCECMWESSFPERHAGAYAPPSAATEIVGFLR